MTGKRAETLLELMDQIEYFTRGRAWAGLTDDEFFWEPFTTAWSVRRQDECRTPNPFGAGEWVADFEIPEPLDVPLPDSSPDLHQRRRGRRALRDGGPRLRGAIERADDGQLEVTTAGYTYAAEPPRGGCALPARRVPRTRPRTSSPPRSTR